MKMSFIELESQFPVLDKQEKTAKIRFQNIHYDSVQLYSSSSDSSHPSVKELSA